MQNNLVPEFLGRPKLANQSPPLEKKEKEGERKRESSIKKRRKDKKENQDQKKKKKESKKPPHDGGGNGDGFDVSDGGRATVQTNVGRERGLQTGLTSVTLKKD